jgi:hypothetical protein
VRLVHGAFVWTGFSRLLTDETFFIHFLILLDEQSCSSILDYGSNNHFIYHDLSFQENYGESL